MKPDSSAKSDSEDLLAPPEFGSFDGGSSDTMLPIATSMEELLDADEVSGPSAAALAAQRFAESEAGEEGSPRVEPEEADEAPKPKKKALASASVADADVPDIVTAGVEEEDPLEPAPSRAPLIIGAAAVILLGIGVAVMSGGSDDAGASTADAAASSPASGSEQPATQPTPTDDPSGVPKKPSVDPSRSKADGGAGGSLPSDLEALKAMEFSERHKLLAVATEDVVVEDHVALDLVQAKDAPEPCRTFSDALSTIESAEDPEPFSWAIDEAVVPDSEDPACAGLSARLDRLKEEEAAAEPTRRSTRRSTKRRSPRSSSRSTAPSPVPQKPEPPEPQPETAEPVKPQPQPKPQPEPQPSVATKLDDEGLKNLD